MALLEEPRHGFTGYDVFLHLLLGLTSLAHRLERRLPPEPSGAAQGPSVPLPAEGNEGPVLLLLGLISLRRTLMNAVGPPRAAANGGSDGEAPRLPTRASVPSPRNLLR